MSAKDFLPGFVDGSAGLGQSLATNNRYPLTTEVCGFL